MNIKRTFLAAAALSLVAFCSQGMAQTYTVGFDSSVYDVDINDTVDVDLFLFEDVSDGSASRLAPGGGNGLFTFSLGVDYSAFTGSAAGSVYNSLTLHPFFTTGFSGSGDDITDNPGLISFEGAEDFAGNDADGEGGVGGIQLSANLWAVELATITFDAGDAGTVTTLQARTHVDTDANVFLFADNSTPDIGFDSAEIRVAAIPEPATASVIGLCMLGFVMRRRSK
jgi:hypothetical protein